MSLNYNLMTWLM